MGSSRDPPPSHSQQKPAESTHGAASKQQHFGNKGPKRRGPAFACAHLRKPPKWNIGMRMNSSYDNGFPMISTRPRHALIWTQVQFSKTWQSQEPAMFFWPSACPFPGASPNIPIVVVESYMGTVPYCSIILITFGCGSNLTRWGPQDSVQLPYFSG